MRKLNFQKLKKWTVVSNIALFLEQKRRSRYEKKVPRQDNYDLRFGKEDLAYKIGQGKLREKVVTLFLYNLRCGSLCIGRSENIFFRLIT